MSSLSEQDKFKSILAELLFPLFPGTVFDQDECVTPPAKNKTKLVTQLNTSARLKLLKKDSDICFQIKRLQPFTASEKEIIKHFLDNISRPLRDYGKSFYKDTASSFLSYIVAKSVSSNKYKVILSILTTMTEWSQQTYEGNRIAFSMGIIQEESPSEGISFNEVVNDDFLKVLSNGHDTILVFNQNGYLVNHEILSPNNDHLNSVIAPLRFSKIAHWTLNENKVAITLNRNGEILIFKNGNLMFAKRRGQWRCFSHSSVISQFTKKGMGRKTSELLRKEIYLTALDVAFTRTGGCLGIINASQHTDVFDNGNLINERDKLGNNQSSLKTKCLNQIIAGRSFQDIDRLLRLELVSIDGATVLDHNGNVLATGAILSVPGGSTGGGRQAATLALAQHGLGIKISNDGYIKVINRDAEVIVEFA